MLPNSDFGQPLHSYAPSPIRGQLEPQDPNTKPGWRYLQCTDTPNELKVLIPPKAALLYSQLLRAELDTLAQPEDGVDWNRLVDIRHLKDRMLRKCLRLSKSWVPPEKLKGHGAPSFIAIAAPEAFRLKELEKWVQIEDGIRSSHRPRNRDSAPPKPSSPRDYAQRKSSVCCDRCARLGLTAKPTRRNSQSTASLLRGDSSLRQVPSQSSIRTEEPTPIPPPPVLVPEPYTEEVQEPFSLPPITPPDAGEIQYQDNLHHDYHGFYPYHDSIHGPATPPRDYEEFTPSSLPNITSPEPLPHPYRHSGQFDTPNFIVTGESTEFPLPTPIPITLRNTPPSLSRSTPSPSDDAPTPLPQPQETPDVAAHPLLRRRSSLKQPDSTGRMSVSNKNVAWVPGHKVINDMTTDGSPSDDLAAHLTKRDVAAEEVRDADSEWEEMRTQYVEQLSGLHAMRQSVVQSLDRLRLETERLQREEGAMREEETRLRTTYEQLERKQAQYREKVQTALQESHHVVSMANASRTNGYGPGVL